jgi:hypothetical protein
VFSAVAAIHRQKGLRLSSEGFGAQGLEGRSIENTGAAAAVAPALELATVVDRSPLRDAPFDHITLQGAFPAAFYREMLARFPAEPAFHPLYHRDAVRPDGGSTRQRLYLYPETLWRLPAAQRRIWRRVAATLCAPALEQAFKRKFRTVLEERFQQPVEQIPLYPVPILVRDLPGYRIGIHADALIKAITVQLYLPRDASQLHLGTVFHTSRRADENDRPVTMPFLPATGYAFAVRRKESWHSVPMTTEADGERRSIMLTYYVDQAPRAKLRRRLQRLGIFLGRNPRY